MKVLQLLQKPQLRGAEIFASQLSNHLEESGVTVHLISVFEGTSELPFTGKISHLKRPLNKRLWDFKAWKTFAELVKREQPDLIQANAGDTLKFAILSKLFYKWDTPVVFRNANKMGDFIDTKPKYLLNRFFVNQVEAVVSVSQLCEKDFIKTFKFPVSRITTIPIGVEEQNTASEPPSDLMSIFSNYRVLVNIGSLVPEKNHETLIDIFDAVAKNDPTVFLMVIGDGRLRTELESKVSGLSSKGRILFAGYRNDVLQVLQHAEAFLMPSLIEGLPAVILEAMYCKTPVIANNVGGISEVVNSETGWLIQKDDKSGFIKAVHEVLNGGEIVNQKIYNAFYLVTKEYMNSQIAVRFKEAYRKIIERHSLS
ncbi:glycosyltransferase involved in cell wall biosynthesis [Pontibacter mucosus]|uniref:Glycosyltransferase involved in cell wall biosynthesis n=1 Tax=Pontibacter mucosus TaxID=1649266 RepID=A0A2T5Y3C6_9BACT|nr:glycosyltransferase [Pontibacter mucosus]PTX10666.1 glycosyltransferase involved in cell wall biosynthesis [Pontibacter mucosus]